MMDFQRILLIAYVISGESRRMEFNSINSITIKARGKFQNLDPKTVTAPKGNFKCRNRNLDKIAVILVVGRGLYVQY